MNRRIIEKLRMALPAYPIEKVWIFGSYARGEETRRSDVDLLVRFMDKENISLFDYIGYKNDLEKILKRKVDLVSEGTLHKFAQKPVEQEKILIYERRN